MRRMSRVPPPSLESLERRYAPAGLGSLPFDAEPAPDETAELTWIEVAEPVPEGDEVSWETGEDGYDWTWDEIPTDDGAFEVGDGVDGWDWTWDEIPSDEVFYDDTWDDGAAYDLEGIDDLEWTFDVVDVPQDWDEVYATNWGDDTVAVALWDVPIGQNLSPMRAGLRSEGEQDSVDVTGLGDDGPLMTAFVAAAQRTPTMPAPSLVAQPAEALPAPAAATGITPNTSEEQFIAQVLAQAPEDSDLLSSPAEQTEESDPLVTTLASTLPTALNSTIETAGPALADPSEAEQTQELDASLTEETTPEPPIDTAF